MVHILNQNLPKKSAEEVIESLKKEVVEHKDGIGRFVDEANKTKYEQNFNLFDRDQDGYIDFNEVVELLLSINQPIEQEELKELFDYLKDKNTDTISFENVIWIIIKIIREDDKETQLKVAFTAIAQSCLPEGMKFNSQEMKVHLETFKEYLMTMGNKMSEDQADEIINLIESQPDPDYNGEPSFDPLQFIESLVKQ